MEPHRATQKAPGHDLDSSCCLTPRSPLARERPLLKPSLKKPSRCCIVHREAGSNSARGSSHLAGPRVAKGRQGSPPLCEAYGAVACSLCAGLMHRTSSLQARPRTPSFQARESAY